MTFKTQLFDALHTCGLVELDFEGHGRQINDYEPVGDCVRLGWVSDKGFADSLDFPNQEVEIDGDGSCQAKDEEGDTYTLRLQVTRPITRADVQASQTAKLMGGQP